MELATADVWFGPGGLKGVFGAGVAHGLQELIESGAIVPSQLRLYGSSVGCLTAAYLATGNAAHGLNIFQDEVDRLIALSNLLPSIVARGFNCLRRTLRPTARMMDVPVVLNIAHVLDVMMRRTPDIIAQLRTAQIPVFAEAVHGRTASFHHVDLRQVENPLVAIRDALNFFPFSGFQESELFDSAIMGFGYTELLRSPARKLVVVLNDPGESGMLFTLGSLLGAGLAVDRQLARLYMQRPSRRAAAIRRARSFKQRVLVICPAAKGRFAWRRDVAGMHAEGRQAAGRLAQFL